MEAWLGELRTYPGEGRASSGWRLAKAAWRLLRADRALAALVLLLATVFTAPFLAGLFVSGLGLGFGSGNFWLHLLANLLVIFASTFLAVAVASAADGAVDGLPLDLREALEDARDCLGPIAGWTLLSLAAWLAAGLAAKGVGGAWLLIPAALVWYLATFFVLPAIAIDRMTPGEALGESLHLARERWREALGGLFGLVVFTGLAAMPPGMMLSHAAALHSAGHGIDYPLVAGALVLLAAVFAASIAAREAFAAMLFREALGDLPGVPYAGPRLRRRTKVARVLAACVVVLVALGALSAVTGDDNQILKDSNEPGFNYTTVVPNPGGVDLPSGSIVYYRESQIGVVLGSEDEGADLRITFHVEPGFGPSQTPGSFEIVGSGGGCPCLVLIPGGTSTEPDVQSS
jgi:hypothetical protein